MLFLLCYLLFISLKARRTAKNKIRYLLRNPFPKNDVNRTAKATNRKSYGVSANVLKCRPQNSFFIRKLSFTLSLVLKVRV